MERTAVSPAACCLTCCLHAPLSCLLSHLLSVARLLPARPIALPVARLLPARPAWHSTHLLVAAFTPPPQHHHTKPIQCPPLHTQCVQVRLYLETGELMTEQDEIEWEMLAEQYFC